MQTMFRDGSIIICGRLGKDVEVKQVGESHKSLATWSVAVGERQGQDGNKETIWVNCQAWHNAARAVAHGRKGDVALCVGKIQTNEYNGKTYKNLVCEFVSFMPNVPAQAVQQVQGDLPIEANTFEDDGVPF